MGSRKTIIIISASSDIGASMARRYLSYGWKVYGTYRRKSGDVSDLINKGAILFQCNLSKKISIDSACLKLRRKCRKWDLLVLCPGTIEPIGPFAKEDPDKWEESVNVNFVRQMRVTRELLSSRRTGSKRGPCVLYFAGGGTNSAPVNYSAYTVSKIALIKMCELLDAEISDTRFVIVGPGWVRTKIHKATIQAGAKAGTNYRRTISKLKGDNMTPMQDVLDCCDWIFTAPRNVVGGRNISVVYDKWGDKTLEKSLSKDGDMYKLRRQGNESMVKNDRGRA